MSNKGFEKATRRDQVPPGALLAVEIHGEPVVLCNVNGTIHAFRDTCPHMGSRLSGGRLSGTTLTCPVHKWRYDTTTGAHLDVPPASLCRYDVHLTDDDIWVRA